MLNISDEEFDNIIDTCFYNDSFEIPIEETLGYFDLSKEDFKYIMEYFKMKV